MEGLQSKVRCSSAVLLPRGIAMAGFRCCNCFTAVYSFGKFVVGFTRGSLVVFMVVPFSLAESVKDEDLEVAKEVYLLFGSVRFCVCSLDTKPTFGKAGRSSFSGFIPVLRQEG